MPFREVELNLPHAKLGKLYIEEDGRWVVHVFPQLFSTDSSALGLVRGLDALMGRSTGYDSYVIHYQDRPNA